LCLRSIFCFFYHTRWRLHFTISSLSLLSRYVSAQPPFHTWVTL
jgi:hypothetical protein